MYLTRNQAYVQTYRGFESHPLRQWKEPFPVNGSLLCAARPLYWLPHGGVPVTTVIAQTLQLPLVLLLAEARLGP